MRRSRRKGTTGISGGWGSKPRKRLGGSEMEAALTVI